MNKRKIGSVAFTVTSEYLVSHYRNMVLSGNYEEALKSFCENVQGMDYNTAIEILKGEKTLSGSSDTDINLIDEDPDVKEEYQCEISEILGDCWRKGNKSYKIAYVALDIVDALYWYRHNIWKSVPCMSGISSYIPPHECARYFNIDDSGLVYTYEKLDQFCDDENNVHNISLVAWKEVSNNRPFWLDMLTTSHEVASEMYTLGGKEIDTEDSEFYQNVVSTRFNCGHYNNDDSRMSKADSKKAILEQRIVILEEEEEAQKKESLLLEMIESDRILILEQSKESVVLTTESGVEYTVPKEPLMAWGLKIGGWKPVSKSGVKMEGDDPNHTDWVIGAGIDPRDIYDKNTHSELNSAAYDYCNYHNKNEIVILTPNRHSTLTDFVTFPEPNGVIKSSIVYIPDCSLKYDSIAKQIGKIGGVIITKQGGALSHLVMHDEYGATIVMCPTATDEIKDGDRIIFDPTKKSINVV